MIASQEINSGRFLRKSRAVFVFSQERSGDVPLTSPFQQRLHLEAEEKNPAVIGHRHARWARQGTGVKSND